MTMRRSRGPLIFL
eukprot:s7742_g1.t1